MAVQDSSKKGLIVQGSHPVGWCPRDQNPVSQHDTIGDVEPDFNEYTIIKFKPGGGDGDDDDLIILPSNAQARDTLGVTNLWVNPQLDYVQAQVDGQTWIISKEAARKLEFLNHKVEIKDTQRKRNNRLESSPTLSIKLSVPVYPASFVEADSGTGIVMSVPAHAPYDYHALEALKSDKNFSKCFIFHLTMTRFPRSK